jgi:hypothetical protein
MQAGSSAPLPYVKHRAAEIIERMGQAQDRVSAIGIDFGTTNSTVARASGKSQVELVAFPTHSGETFSFRSVLYLQQVKQAGRAKTHTWTGPAAIEHYLAAENKGRLIQSLKSYLSDRTLTGTAVFGRHCTLEDLISRILADLRRQAETQFGSSVGYAMVGRPVRFVGAETESILSWNRSLPLTPTNPPWITTSSSSLATLAAAPAIFPSFTLVPAYVKEGVNRRICWATAASVWPAMPLMPGSSVSWSPPPSGRSRLRVRSTRFCPPCPHGFMPTSSAGITSRFYGRRT